nr:reverse transcriptase domain-containing protein [Tanacetum cinerariifolium]
MADTRTMSELLQAPTEGYGDAIVIPAILAEDLELKVGLLQLVTSSQFYGFERDDPLRVPDLARKKPSCSIHTWEDLVFKFVNYLFPPSKTTNLKNNITNFQQKFVETLSEAWDRFKDLLPKCPHHGFSKLHQIDTFYNALTQSDQDSLNAAVDGNLLNRTPRDALTIIENKSKVRTSRNKPVVSKVNTTTYSSSPSPDFTVLTYIVKELVLMNKANQQASVKAIEETRQSPSGSRSLPNNTVANPIGDVKSITTRSGVAYNGPTIPPTSSPLSKEVECETEATKDKVQTTRSESTARVQPPVVQVTISKPDVAPKPNPKPLHSDLSFTDALLHIPKFASMFKSLLSNKERLFEFANTPLTENFSAVLLKKLPEKLRDPGRFLIRCDFQGLESCIALADLDASINLMPLSVWKKLSLPDLTPTYMTLELATRSYAYPAGIAKDVFVQVGKFTFSVDLVVVDYDVDPRVPLILGRPFLRTARALVDVHGEEHILRDGDEKLIFYADSTPKHPHKHGNDTTPLSDSSPSLTPFETSDSLLEEFVDKLDLLDLFPPGNEDDNFEFESDLREIEFLLNQDPSTKSIDPILKKFTDEPSLDYFPPSGDDDDDLFDLKSDNDE